MMRVTSGGSMRSASDGSLGAASTQTPVSCATMYSSMCACEVGLVGVLALEGVEDRVLRAAAAGRWTPRRTAGRGRRCRPASRCSGSGSRRGWWRRRSCRTRRWPTTMVKTLAEGARGRVAGRGRWSTRRPPWPCGVLRDSSSTRSRLSFSSSSSTGQLHQVDGAGAHDVARGWRRAGGRRPARGCMSGSSSWMTSRRARPERVAEAGPGDEHVERALRRRAGRRRRRPG